MLEAIRGFRDDDDGAVTVDWVVLTAFMILLATGLTSMILAPAMDPVDGLGAWIASFVTP
jgi:Flp pilus assembly pilin Flp